MHCMPFLLFGLKWFVVTDYQKSPSWTDANANANSKSPHEDAFLLLQNIDQRTKSSWFHLLVPAEPDGAVQTGFSRTDEHTVAAQWEV